MTGVEETATHGGGHEAGEFQLGEMLAHHMVDSQELDLPFTKETYLHTGFRLEGSLWD